MQVDYFKDPEHFAIAETYKIMGITFLKMGDMQKA